MDITEIPAKFRTAFADAGDKNLIPQSSVVAGQASYEAGFPPATRTPLGAGGVPPAGLDFNGILNAITQFQRWQSASGSFQYDATFSAQVGGYPKGAVLLSADGKTEWLCLQDDNTTNPDATDGSAANWVPLSAYGLGLASGLTNVNVTLTPAQYSKDTIILSGVLTGNVQIIFPKLERRWLVVNNTTGAFTLTCKTDGGIGTNVSVGSPEEFYGDGANIIARTYGQPTQFAGMIAHFPVTVPPVGWLKANGSTVSRSQYPALFAIIGTTFGAPTGTTFNLPDLRGEFIRSLDDGRGIDVGRVMGSVQQDAFEAHTHTIFEGSNVPQPGGNLTSGDDFTTITAFPQISSSVGGTETRPRNIALLACIKF